MRISVKLDKLFFFLFDLAVRKSLEDNQVSPGNLSEWVENSVKKLVNFQIDMDGI